MQTTEQPKGFWDDAEIISTYSRAQGFEDGFLIDVKETAREAGFSIPVAITAALYADINAIPQSKSYQNFSGRLWDVLWMGRLAARRGGSQTVYSLIMHVGRTSRYQVKMVCGPDDDGAPCLTLMRADED